MHGIHYQAVVQEASPESVSIHDFAFSGRSPLPFLRLRPIANPATNLVMPFACLLQGPSAL